MSEQVLVENSVDSNGVDAEVSVHANGLDWVKKYRGKFETLFPPKSHWLSGRIEATFLDSGIAPNTIIRIQDDWYVDIYWSLTGTLQSLICGEWCIHLHMESIGEGKEFNYPRNRREIRVPVKPCGNGRYYHRLKVPGGTVKADECGIPYETAVTVTMYDECGNPASIVGIVKGPMIHFHQGKNGRNGRHAASEANVETSD